MDCKKMYVSTGNYLGAHYKIDLFLMLILVTRNASCLIENELELLLTVYIVLVKAEIKENDTLISKEILQLHAVQTQICPSFSTP